MGNLHSVDDDRFPFRSRTTRLVDVGEDVGGRLPRVAVVDDRDPVRAESLEPAADLADEGVTGHVGVQDHPRQQITGGTSGPRLLQDAELGRAEQPPRPALLELAPLEPGLGEQRHPGELAGEDDAVGLVGAVDVGTEAMTDLVDVLGERPAL